MPGINAGGGQYEVNGVQVTAAEYKQFERLWSQVNDLSDATSEKIRKLENEIQDTFFKAGHHLRGLLWEFIGHSHVPFSTPFRLAALLEALTTTPNTNLTAYVALRGLETFPAESWAELAALLRQRLLTLHEPAETVVSEVLERIEHRAKLLAAFNGETSSVNDWLALWLDFIRNGAYGDYDSTPLLPALPQGPERLELLKNLLELESKDFQPPETASAYEQKVFPGVWNRARRHALTFILKERLTPAEDRLVMSELIEKVSTPLDRLALNDNGYDKTLHLAVQRARDAGQSSPLALAALRRTLLQAYQPSPDLKWVNDVQTPELNLGEAWADAFLANLDELSPQQRQPWPALLAFARSASAGKPTAKWLKEAQKHVDAVGADRLRAVLVSSLPLLSKPRTLPLQPVLPAINGVLDSFNALSLKGLLWMVPLVADHALTRTLSGVVESALKKVPGVGPREPKVANAAVYALGQIDSEVALSALARLSTTVTFKGTLKEVQKALDVVSKRLNISPDELLDMGVPTLGLTSVGERVERLGDAEARLTVDTHGAKLTFSKGGKALKSVPAAVKKDFADELKELKTAQKEAEQAVSALAQRLDSLMIQPRVWKGEQWQERYLNHPLAGTVARRLIWLVNDTPAFWADDELRDVNGEPVTVQPESIIKLWHPISQPVEEVLTWRDSLDKLDVRQPFKQAWREVYVLTDAERRTNTYSNRFAGHILKQHQFHALAALRGWRNKLRLMVDDSYPPATRDLPAYGLRAEYWIEGIGENYGEDTTESGSFLRLTTDQVRFYPLDAPENFAHAGLGRYTMWVNQTQQPVHPLPLEDIPPLVLSEILRDVDLFVGVASVGNDPTWQDGGPGGRFREYWRSYSFGELTETAKTRAEYLKRLIPRLNIKDRLELDGRFLRVRGDRKTYKIHLGSSNILMEPNDQYLCIVPGGKEDGLEVDFDGDRVLSLVLSKAFLLADDTKITDPVILQQLKS